MKRTILLALLLPALAMSNPNANEHDKAVAGRYEAREADWRNGPVVYQVLVDRFAPSANLDAKRHLYPAPKRLHPWTAQPQRGSYLEGEKLWSHEIDFWGGDLASLSSKLDHVQQLGADVLYLNPIPQAYTNHKYDAQDYNAVSPEFGSREDVKRLAQGLHAKGMKLVLDGVFNHMGRNSAAFRLAEKDPRSPWREWFVWGAQYPGGARVWWGAENLPELNLESPRVRAALWGEPDSPVRSWLRDGVDGWRLDVAYDIGFNFLSELTRAAHQQKPGSLVVGEVPNFPKEWLGPVDGVMHFGLRRLLIATANGQLPAAAAQAAVERVLLDAPYEHILKSWIYLDNHDTPRLATTVKDPAARRLALALMFALPGSPNLYYGSEVDMEGGEDPEMRGPMAWDRVAAGHPALELTRQLIRLRKQHRALRVGDYRKAEAQQLIAFERHTDRVADTVLVLANPGNQPVTETVLVANSKIMDGALLRDLLDGSEHPIQSALLPITVPAKGVRWLVPLTAPRQGYSHYKRVQ